ncbi:MAG TPA: hypothetical protein V6D07_18600 [Trichocoleus sp.]
MEKPTPWQVMTYLVEEGGLLGDQLFNGDVSGRGIQLFDTSVEVFFEQYLVDSLISDVARIFGKTPDEIRQKALAVEHPQIPVVVETSDGYVLHWDIEQKVYTNGDFVFGLKDFDDLSIAECVTKIIAWR